MQLTAAAFIVFQVVGTAGTSGGGSATDSGRSKAGNNTASRTPAQACGPRPACSELARAHLPVHVIRRVARGSTAVGNTVQVVKPQHNSHGPQMWRGGVAAYTLVCALASSRSGQVSASCSSGADCSGGQHCQPGFMSATGTCKDTDPVRQWHRTRQESHASA